MTLLPRTRLGRYEILSHIGSGGMGEVYLAHDVELERDVALKVLPADATSDERRMRRFIQEAKAVSALNHPNIITIHEIGQAGDVHFIATEFVKGITLFERIQSALMKLGEMIDVSMQVASALAMAHEAGIVHRDIKPENIMLRHDGYVKVLDFGLAKLATPMTIDAEAQTKGFVKTDPGMVVGTLRYMSPEQARGQDLDRATDIWSLGVVMYQMVAGRYPFSGSTGSDVMASILLVEPAPLSDYWPEVPEELNRIVLKALEKHKQERYHSAGDLLVDLRLLKQRLDKESELERITRPVRQFSSPSTAGTAAAATKTTASLRRATKSSSRSRPSKKTIDSVAILPFINASNDPEIEYLSDGITESIINTLSQIPKLRVMARSTVFCYKGKEVDPREVGDALGVRAVLTGKILELGQKLIVKAEFVDVADGSQLWGEHYNRNPDDILGVQEEISREITAKLRLRLSVEQKKRLKKRHTENSNAYQLYLKGRYFWNKRTEEGLKKGIEFFNQAVEEDPLFALAYAGLADSYNMLGTYNLSPPRAVLGPAKAAAERALQIDNQLAEAHSSLAKVRSDYDWNWRAAEEEFNTALELNPSYATGHHWYALHLLAMGRFDEATTEIKRAYDLDPLSLSISVSMGLPFYWSRRYDQAIEQFRRTLEFDPSFPLVHVLLGQAYVEKGMFKEAICELETARTLEDTPRARAILGYALGVAGRTDEAARILSELEELAGEKYVSPYFRVLIYTALGERDQALEWLSKAYEERGEWLVWLKVDPKLDSLRSDPRFKEALKNVGLPL